MVLVSAASRHSKISLWRVPKEWLTLPLMYSVVISVFAIIILSVIGALFRSGHEEFVGSIEQPKPEEGAGVAATIFTAVIVYAVSQIKANQSFPPDDVIGLAPCVRSF